MINRKFTPLASIHTRHRRIAGEFGFQKGYRAGHYGETARAGYSEKEDSWSNTPPAAPGGRPSPAT